MTLRFSARHSFGNFSIDASFEAGHGVTALFGKSGSGKTSMLKMIAGLIAPDEGEISFDGSVLFSSEQAHTTPPHKRHFSYVFQESRLFPHLSVRQNLRYGAWIKRKQLDAKEFDRTVDLLGIGQLLNRQPLSLSGGEQQRVAIGRALLASPRLLLMDEPLASLDQRRKAEILPYLEDLCAEAKMPIIYVSHSLNEVMRLANQVVLLEAGRVSSVQDPQTLNQNATFLSAIERNELGALIEGTVLAFDTAQQLVTIGVKGGQLIASNNRAAIGAKLKIFISARDVMLALKKPEGLSAINILQCTIASIDRSIQGHANIHLDYGGEQIVSQITASSCDRLGLNQDMDVHAIIKAVSFEEL